MTQMQKWNSPARLFFILILIQVLHSFEEIVARLYLWLPRVTGRLQEAFDFIPQVSFTRETFIIANVVVVALMLVVGGCMRGQRPWPLRIAFAIGIIELVNGAAHLFGAAAAGGYFPGAISGVALIIAGALFLRSYKRFRRSTA